MKSWLGNINGFFCVAALACLLGGCKTTEEKQRDKVQTILRFHLEVNPDGSDRNAPVPVYRQRPEMVNVENAPFLDSASITEAAVVDMEGGFGIRIQLDIHGSRVLENVTASNLGKRFAIYAIFPKDDPKNKVQETRWLAAPRITRRIANGIIVFTPDATRAECERMILGVNNVAVKLSNAPK